jgi:tRNA(fMet)-specific endonuclease VapC
VKYLLDTNILSEMSKDKPDAKVIAKINEYGDSCVTAALVIHEINYGVRKLPKGKFRDNLQIFLQQLEVYQFQVLPYDNDAALYHASERARLVAKGLTPAFADGQIAAISATNNLTLVTRNISDFENFDGLSLENWFD